MPSMGEKIRAARTQRGLTQTDLSSDLVTPSMISQIEADKAKPSHSLLSAISNRLGLPIEYFMEDLEDQNVYATYMKLAEFYVLRQEPAKARAVLHRIPAPDSPGLVREQYQLLLAKTHRLHHQYMDAIRAFEELREQATRNQDFLMQFQVCKESGHVEYALDNLEGAMHEWSNALLLGDKLQALDTLTTIECNHMLAEVCVLLYRLQMRQGNEREAHAYLEQAQVFCTESSRLRDIVNSLIQDTEHALNHAETVKGKTAIEGALTILCASKWVEQNIWVQAHFLRSDADSGVDALAEAALSTATIHSHGFIEAELTQIDRALDQDDMPLAERKLARCFDIMQDYEVDADPQTKVPAHLWTKLKVTEAKIERKRGQPEKAIALLDELASQLNAREEYRNLVQVLAWKLKWASEDGHQAHVLALTKELQELIDHVYSRPQRL